MEDPEIAGSTDNNNTTSTTTKGLASLVGDSQTQATNTTTEVNTSTVTPFNTFNEVLTEDGRFAEKWTERLPEGLKIYEKTLSKFQNPVDLLNSYANLEKSFSSRTNGVKIPGDDAKDEDWAKYREAVGAPKEATEYGLARPENVPEDQWNGDLATKASEIALKYGIPKKALGELVETYNGSVKDVMTRAEAQMQKQVDNTVETLTKEWGADSKTQWQKAARAAEAVGLPLDDDAIMRPDIIKALLKVDDLLGDDKGLVHGDNTSESYEDKLNNILKGDDFNGKNGWEKQKEAQARHLKLYNALHSR